MTRHVGRGLLDRPLPVLLIGLGTLAGATAGALYVLGSIELALSSSDVAASDYGGMSTVLAFVVCVAAVAGGACGLTAGGAAALADRIVRRTFPTSRARRVLAVAVGAFVGGFASALVIVPVTQPAGALSLPSAVLVATGVGLAAAVGLATVAAVHRGNTSEFEPVVELDATAPRER